MNHIALINAARLAEKAGRLGLATDLYTRSAKGPALHRAEALFRLANLESQSGDLADVRRMLEEAVEIQPERAAWHYRLATVMEKQGDKDDALSHYRSATELQPTNIAWAQRLERCENAVRVAKAQADDERAKSFRKKGERWRELEILQASLPNFSKSPDWFLRLGDSLEAMGRFREAAEAFEEANSLRPNRAENLFREGYCWRKAGRLERAEEAFQSACENDGKHHSKELGIGVFFERRGMWHEAASQFDADCAKHPLVAELQFRAGRALERSYFWKEAAHRYRQATLLSPATARNHFRLGFSLERMDDFAAAEDCYSYAIDLLRPTATVTRYWYYRLGVVREAQGRFEAAVEAYTASLDVPGEAKASDQTEESTLISKRQAYGLELLIQAKHLALKSADTAHILSVARQFELREMWEDAATCLEAAADRNQVFSASIYFRLGKAYGNLGLHEAAACAFRMTRISVPPRGIDTARHENDVVLQRHFEYAEMMENLPLRDNVIFYESFLGEQITCNPYALFQQIIGDPKYKDYVHAWSVNPTTKIPFWMQNLDNVIFVERGSHLNRRYLATAKYLINNVTFPAYFVRREGQQYLNTWHGTPLKTLGKDVGTGVLEHRNVARNFLQSTHIVTSNDHTTRVLLERYDVETIATAEVAYTGYPRIDLTLELNGDKRTEILESLNIAANDRRKIVLYAPTWRGGAAFKYFDTARLTADLKALADLDCVVLFQGHHLSVALLPGDLPVRVVSDEINTNELLAVVDVLITDYSSILFDFFPTRRPIICYAYDLEEYQAERGLYFTPSELGLIETSSTDTLIDSVAAALLNPETFATPEDLVDRFCGREDGKAAARVVSFFLDNDSQWNVPRLPQTKRRYLFHHSMLPNGISSSLTNLLKSLDPEKSDVTVVVPAGVIEKNEGAVGVLRGLPPYVKVVADAGRQVVNIEEKWLIDYFNRWHILPSSRQRELYMGAFKREYRRLLGDAEFDVIVEFEGYSRYWTSLLAAASGKKVIYLHSDMIAERTIRLPYLQGVFELYKSFDFLASVSPALSALNSERIGRIVGVEGSRFVPLMNQIDYQGVQQGAGQPLDDDLSPWFSAGSKTVMTMGRLSVEKDHAKLLRAMARVIEMGYEANLVLLGDGPLRQDLEQLVGDLGLRERVFFAGHRENPFPALRAAHCFVLPSNHEGQPMVLLESMMVGTPIVATDIPGSRQVLSENLGCLVQNSVDGLAFGIIEVLQGRQETASRFDVEGYWHATREAFLELTQ